MKSIIDEVKKRVVVFDGAMGTEIYNKGFFINSCYDELSLTRPDIIGSIHTGYVEAGADVIETNSFGANKIKLASYGLADKCEIINYSAAKIARDIADKCDREIFVAGAIGPVLLPSEKFENYSIEILEDTYKTQIESLKKGGVDFIIFETFSSLNELLLACKIAKNFELETVACFTTVDENQIINQNTLDLFSIGLDNSPFVDMIGLNCGSGAATIFENLKYIIKKVKKPMLVMPNAGLPKDIDGRLIYLNSPEYFTEYAKRFVTLGVRAVGGCCGSTYAHIKDVAKTLKSFTAATNKIKIEKVAIKKLDKGDIEKKSKLAFKILNNKMVKSIELTPPAGVTVLDSMIEKAKICKEANIDVINIPDGPRASSRLSPLVSAIQIETKVGIETVLHYCCRDRNLIGMQSDLLGLQAMGLKNVLLITGDPPKLGAYPDATGVFDVDAVGLTTMATNLNNGYDIIGGKINPPTDFFIGVGANPYAIDLDKEVEHLIRKVDAGAQFIITQPIFDANALLKFMDIIDKRGKMIPVIAGVWPLVSYKNALFMKNEVPGVVVPDEIVDRMSSSTTKEEGLAIGVKISKEICKTLEKKVAGFQVSAPLGNVNIAVDVLDF